ncbi:MAG: HlyC/CorC family transporter [Deltaproteobacteria bacterium]|nr:HlyC/CorC family transporter [Deltaproteobacteria bacterium]
MLAYWLVGTGLFLSALVSAIETALVGIPDSLSDSGDGERSHDSFEYWRSYPAAVRTVLHVFRIVGVFVYACGVVTVVTHAAEDLATLILLFAAAIIVGSSVQIAARLVAKRNVLVWATFGMTVVHLLRVVGFPLVAPVQLFARLGGRLSGQSSKANPYWTLDELAALSERIGASDLGNPSQELLRSIIEFSDTLIREIMVPRTEMVTLPITASATDVRQMVLENGHSRIPVYNETIDQIEGLLHVKRLFAAEIEANRSGTEAVLRLEELLKPTFYVPEVMKISELLREFQRRKTHMAIVVDEYGGTAGVVTLEDIIEEIVGEIQDEYDVEERQFLVVSDTKILADGRVDLDELEEVIGVTFPDDNSYETLAGFVTFQAGYLPEPGTVLRWGGMVFTVKDADEKRISTVEIERHEGFALPAPVAPVDLSLDARAGG